MLPFKLEPVYKSYLWGGEKLKCEYHKESSFPTVAESWELSARTGASSTIASGGWKGQSFCEFYREHSDLCGEKVRGCPAFPILIKLIDAQKPLSVQVHPNDRYAADREGDLGKTEMWVVLDCERDAYIYYGFERSVNKAIYREAIQNSTLTSLLRKVYVKPGDVFFIPAGTIHAIGAGIVLAEIQENSDVTYRIFDYGRLGADGKPRPLQVGKALDVTKLDQTDIIVPGHRALHKVPGGNVQRLASCPYFTVDRVEMRGQIDFEMDGSSFASLLCIEGKGTLSVQGSELRMRKGDSLFVPSTVPRFSLAGNGQLLITTM